MMTADTRSQAKREGANKLLDSAGISVDRLPMLHVVLDRMANGFADGLRTMCATPPFITVGEISTGRLGDILDRFDGHVVAGILYAEAWDARIMLALDRGFVFTMVEQLFGGDGTELPLREERAFSNIELRIAQAIFTHAAKALQTAFAQVADTVFTLERLETRLDFAVIGRRNNPALVSGLNLSSMQRGGNLFLVVPQTALNPIRQNLARDLSSEIAARDPRWAKQIQHEVSLAEVTLRAVLEEKHFTLGDIADLKVGQVLELRSTPEGQVKLEANDQPVFWCRLGQADGHYTLRVESTLDEEEEFMNGLLR